MEKVTYTAYYIVSSAASNFFKWMIRPALSENGYDDGNLHG
jgi:hypothetical protein